MQSSVKKTDSLKSIVDSLNVDLVTANETHLIKNNKFKLEGFNCFPRNRQNAAKGGIATCIREKHAKHALKVAEGKSVEYLVTRLGQFDPAINIINYYGAQESR